MTTDEFVSVLSILVGGLLGVTVLALVDRYCRDGPMRTLAIVCAALALAGCATRTRPTTSTRRRPDKPPTQSAAAGSRRFCAP